MNVQQARLARKQLERRIAPLRDVSFAAPPRGWIRAIRDSLGMTARQLALRLGTSPSRIPVIERAEVSGSVTVRTLRETAAAMNCAFVYAFVPLEPLEEMLQARAVRKASREISRLDHTMRLENQALRKRDLDAEKQRTIEATSTGSLRGLWDDEP